MHMQIEYAVGRAGLIYATSPDLKGLLVARSTFSKLELEIPQIVADLYAANGEKVVVTWADEFGDSRQTLYISRSAASATEDDAA